MPILLHLRARSGNAVHSIVPGRRLPEGELVDLQGSVLAAHVLVDLVGDPVDQLAGDEVRALQLDVDLFGAVGDGLHDDELRRGVERRVGKRRFSEDKEKIISYN